VSETAEKWTPPHVDDIVVEPIPPPPPNYRDILIRARHVLRGAQVVVDNHMLPERLEQPIYSGAVQGLISYLDSVLDQPENQVEVILQAITIQRAALARAGVL
jgi:hypothetical protein